jgi:hypothetical protein
MHSRPVARGRLRLIFGEVVHCISRNCISGGRIESTLPAPRRVSEGLRIDANLKLNTAHKALLNLGYAAYRCPL